jgi:poly(A) polymerase Pap1
MTILTPVSPSYNTAYTLTPSGFAMICSELELGAKIMKEASEGLQDLSALFEEIDFFQQFRYFIKLEIMACGSQDYETWSGLVLSRVKNLMLDLERVYPRPQVCFYAKSFELLSKQFKNSKAFFIGLKFHVSQCVKLDIRGPIQSFCGFLNESRPNKSTMCLKCSFLNKKDLINLHAKQMKIGFTHN